MKFHCHCSASEARQHCPVWDRAQGSRAHAICQGYTADGAPVDPETRSQYAAQWLRDLLTRHGLGDDVAALTRSAGVTGCGSCQSRRQTLNTIAPPDHWVSRLLSPLLHMLATWLPRLTAWRKTPPAPRPFPQLDFSLWQVTTDHVAPGEYFPAAADDVFHVQMIAPPPDHSHSVDAVIHSRIRPPVADPTEWQPQDIGHPIPRHVTRWAVGVTTAPRRIPTLARTITSLQSTGFDRVTVFAEPRSDLRDTQRPGVQIVQRPDTISEDRFPQQKGPRGKFGAYQNYVQTLADLLHQHPDAQAIMIVQDDVVFTRGLRDFLEHDLWPSETTGVVSLYCPRQTGRTRGYEDDDQPRCKLIKSNYLVGACAFIFPRHVAEQILDHELSRNWKGLVNGSKKNPWDRKAIDGYIGLTVRRLDLKARFYTPSLCQHVATTSAVGHGGNQGFRSSKKFPGESVRTIDVFRDAAALPWIRRSLPGGDQRFPPSPVEQHSTEPVHVVIPAVDAPDLTVRCLEHLAASRADAVGGRLALHVIYVDNGSSAETLTQVESAFDRLQLSHEIIRNETNLGFSPAINQGLSRSHGHHVLLINNDCFVGADCIARLKRHIERHPRVGAVGPLTGDDGVHSLKRRERRQAAQVGALRTYDDPAAGNAACQREYISEEPVLSFFCVLLHRDALREIGPLDSRRFPAGLGADDDWCHRVRRQHRLCLIAHNAFAAHLHRSTFRREKINRRQLQRAAVRELTNPTKPPVTADQ